MKFLRQLIAVAATVAVVVALGLLWAHLCGGGAEPAAFSGGLPRTRQRPGSSRSRPA